MCRMEDKENRFYMYIKKIIVTTRTYSVEAMIIRLKDIHKRYGIIHVHNV